MEKEQIIGKTIEYVKANMKNGESGHDWFHIERVWKMAKRIGEEEGANMFTVELAALLHDIADWKFHEEGACERKAAEWMEIQDVDKAIINQVIHIIEDISFKGSGEKEKMTSLECKVVQDADRLDALGAIGIARAFTFGGYKNISIHDPKMKPRNKMNYSQYKILNETVINHFYEKLLLLKDRMNTGIGRKLAEQRHKFMEQYLEQFFKETGGES